MADSYKLDVAIFNTQGAEQQLLGKLKDLFDSSPIVTTIIEATEGTNGLLMLSIISERALDINSIVKFLEFVSSIDGCVSMIQYNTWIDGQHISTGWHRPTGNSNKP